MYEILARASLLAGLPHDDLHRLGERSSERQLARGECLFEEGEPGDACYFILEGRLAVTKMSGGQEIVLAERGPGDVIGEMALIDDVPRSASVSAREDSRLIVVEKKTFQELLASSPAAALNTLQTSVKRLRETQAALHQSEKLAALGTMTAGVAHELNNPSAAAHRAADQLTESLGKLHQAALALGAIQMGPDQREALTAAQAELEARAATPAYMDALTRSDLEAALEEWLEARQIEAAWELAPLLVSAGYDLEGAKILGDTFEAAHLPAIVNWLSASYASLSLLAEIRDSTQRLSEIVRAMKQYVYLDQAPVQEVDIHEGLENTLVILGHKLKEGITLTRDYASDLPRITAYGSELTQVWTNLIDNAVDAMQGKGHLTIRTRAQDNHVVVEISDDGPGIPEHIQARLFEPFFTTKPPGEGTGLGLHISHNIVVNKHGGQIRVASGPDGTTFTVTLPIQGGPIQ